MQLQIILMRKIITFIFIFLILPLIVGCATTKKTLEPNLIQYPDRTIEDWNPSLAEVEAKQNIQNGSIKVYMSGTYAAYFPGISKEYYTLIKNLPKADAGIGCVIEDVKLRKQQLEYAEKYNKIILEHLTTSSNGLDPAVNAANRSR